MPKPAAEAQRPKSPSGAGGGGGSMLELLVCSVGIFFFYFQFSLAQHDIYEKQEDGTRFSYTSLQLFAMTLANVVGAYFANLVLSPIMGTSPSLSHSPPVFSMRQLSNPYSWLSIGLCFYGAMDASNRSLSHLPYPIMVLFKSCKMVPVMFAGVLINKTKYAWTKYTSVFIVTTGLVFVNLSGGKGKDDKEIEMYPLLLLLLSLVLDAVVGPRQEHHRDTCKQLGTPLSPWETMFKTNLSGLVWAALGCYLSNGFTDGVAYVTAHPGLWAPFAQFALFSVAGQVFIFYTIIKVSALACTTMCTTRKFFTIVYTATVKGNPLNKQQWIGASLIMGGLLFDMVTKSRGKKQVQKKDKPE